MAVLLPEFNETELKEAVKSNLGVTEFTIKDFNIRPASDSPLGFLGDHVRITINIEILGEEKKLHYFAKKVPTKVKAHYEYAKETKAFYKEIELYKTVFKDFKNALTPGRHSLKWRAEYFYSRGTDMFILEDLSVQGFYMVPDRSLVELDHIKATINSIAVLHAASIIFEEKLNAGKATTLSSKHKPGVKSIIFDLYPNLIFETEANDIKGHPGNKYWEAGCRSQLGIIDLLPDYTEEQRKILKENVAEKMRYTLKFVKPSEKFKNVFLHGDLWANNILYRKDESGKVESVVVDFQLARYGPPAHDLLMLLYLCQNRSFRQKYEAELIEQYYSALTAELAAEGLDINILLPRSEFDASIEYYREYVILNNLSYFQLILIPSHIAKKFLSSPELFDLNFNCDRTEMIVACYKEDEICRDRVTEAMREFAEFYKWV